MKHSYIYVVAAALALAGCAREMDIQTPEMTGNNVEQVAFPTLRGVAENDGSTKAQMANTGAFTWTAGDAATVFDVSGSSLAVYEAASGDADDVDFNYLSGASLTPAIGVYPSVLADEVTDFDGTTLSITLPDSYSMTSGASMLAQIPMLAKASGSDLFFKHMGGLLKVNLGEIAQGVKYFKVTAAGKKINGAFTADVTEEYPTIVTCDTGVEEEQTITLSYPAALASAQEEVLYIPLPVGTYSKVTVEIFDGSDVKVGYFEKAGSITINRRTMAYLVHYKVEHIKSVLAGGGTIDLTDVEAGDEAIALDFSAVTSPSDDYTIVYGTNKPGKVYITGGASTNAGTISGDLSSSTVDMIGGSFGGTSLKTAASTLIIREGVTVKSVNVEQGNLSVEGKVDEVTVATGATADGGSAPVEVEIKATATSADEAKTTVTLNAPADVTVAASAADQGSSVKVEVNDDADGSTVTAVESGSVNVDITGTAETTVKAEDPESVVYTSESTGDVTIDEQGDGVVADSAIAKACAEGTDYTLTADEVVTRPLVVNKSWNVDLAGYALTLNDGVEGKLLTVQDGASLSIASSVEGGSVTGGIEMNDLVTVSSNVTVDQIVVSGNQGTTSTLRAAHGLQLNGGTVTNVTVNAVSYIKNNAAKEVAATGIISEFVYNAESSEVTLVSYGAQNNDKLEITTATINSGIIQFGGSTTISKYVELGTVNVTGGEARLTSGAPVTTVNISGGTFQTSFKAETVNLLADGATILETSSTAANKISAINANGHTIKKLQLQHADLLAGFDYDVEELAYYPGTDAGYQVDLTGGSVGVITNGTATSSSMTYLFVTPESASHYSALGEYVVLPVQDNTSGPVVLNDEYSLPTLKAATQYYDYILKGSEEISLKLLSDIDAEPYWIINGGKQVVLDMNGKTVNFLGNVKGSASSKQAVYIQGTNQTTGLNSSLTINGWGKINATTADSNWLFVVGSSTRTYGNLVVNGNVTVNTYYVAALVAQNAGSKVYINNGTWKSVTSGNEFLFNKNANSSGETPGVIEIAGGRYYGWNPADNEADGAGTNYVKDGYTALHLFNGTCDIYDVVPGNTDVTNGSELLDIVKNSGVYTLTDDITAANLAAGIISATTNVLNLNGHTYTCNRGGYGAILGRGSYTMVINGDGAVVNQYDDTPLIWAAAENVSFTINGGTFDSGQHCESVYCENGAITINGGVFKASNSTGNRDASGNHKFLLNCKDANYKAGTARIIVKGGRFYDFDPSNCASEGAGTNFVAAGYKVVTDTDGDHTVYEVVAE